MYHPYIFFSMLTDIFLCLFTGEKFMAVSQSALELKQIEFMRIFSKNQETAKADFVNVE